ncbi:uncharacterized protein A4U43_C01F21560 [Asparagus officinalis]|uniref:Protein DETOXIFICATION n=1 Tax=Asparagus officinalis TaxID=4686 RepID=A0A5P1FRQ2_ASPOF|nr:uncharacterized protein A4U43_C01F21560 [Asparagus officinalis]
MRSPYKFRRVLLGGVPIAVGLSFGLDAGFCGLWTGLLAAQICCAGLMMYVVGTTDWDAQARRAQLLTCAEGEELDIDINEEKIKNYDDDEDYHEEKEGDEVCCVPLVSIKTDDPGR